MRSFVCTLVFLLAMSSCGAPKAMPPQPTALPTSTHPAVASAPTVWIAPSVPPSLRQSAETSELLTVADRTAATLELGPNLDASAGSKVRWFYALAAPFPTVLDGVASSDLREVWQGSSTAAFSTWPLWMTESTRAAFTKRWGEARGNIKIADAEQLLDTAWSELPAWAIIPFEDIEPRWKILDVDGQSPIRKDFEGDAYELAIDFAVTGGSGRDIPFVLPAANRDPSKLTTVILTGTSGLVRELAYQMETKGLTYPARDIGDWLRQADVLHISNEASFDPACPPPNPLKSRFACSSPKYIALFDDVGVDVVELTGNHILDHGTDSLLYTLDLYEKHGMSTYGGGATLSDAREPLVIEHNGNRIAFLGCNFAEPPQPLATARSPGANPCDWKLLAEQIGDLRIHGYLPIVTFQYKEGYSPVVMPWQSIDFRRATEAGAAIVSGSQSHVPMQMEFHEGGFIHYGLGNLFFGQMANQPPGPGLPLQPAQRYEFLDRHVFYDGRYMNTELLTAMLEDYARPRPMTAEERAGILEAYFSYSGWLPFVPTPAPEKTPTLYPSLNFVPLPTYTPIPKTAPTP